MASENCLFCKIVAGEIPANIAHRDDVVTAFHDINPQAPTHILIVPNTHIADVSEAQAEHDQALGHLLRVAAQLGAEQGLGGRDRGYRLVINYGNDAGMTVSHLHLHLLGGRTLAWPPG